MPSTILLLLSPLLVAAVACVVLTALGGRRRGNSRLASALAGLFFPVSWAVWYVRDEHPYAHRSA